MNRYIANGDLESIRPPVSHGQVFWIKVEEEDWGKTELIERLKEEQRQRLERAKQERERQEQQREQQKQKAN